MPPPDCPAPPEWWKKREREWESEDAMHVQIEEPSKSEAMAVGTDPKRHCRDSGITKNLYIKKNWIVSLFAKCKVINVVDDDTKATESCLESPDAKDVPAPWRIMF